MLNLIGRKSFSRVVLIGYYACLLLTSFESLAAGFVGPITAATGGAGRAGTEATETHLLNPAVIVHGPEAAFSAYFIDGYLAEGRHDRIVGATLLENKSDSFFSGALTYADRKRHFGGVGSVEEMFVQVSGAKFIGKYVSLGLSASYLKQELVEKYDQINGSIGIMYTPTSSVGLGLVYQNFVSPKEDTPEFLNHRPEIGFGSTWLYEEVLKFKGDISLREVSLGTEEDWLPEYFLGFESRFGEYLALRLGWKKSEVTGYSYYTGGLGFKGPKFHLNYAYEQKDTRRYGALHSVDITVGF